MSRETIRGNIDVHDSGRVDRIFSVEVVVMTRDSIIITSKNDSVNQSPWLKMPTVLPK